MTVAPKKSLAAPADGVPVVQAPDLGGVRQLTAAVIEAANSVPRRRAEIARLDKAIAAAKTELAAGEVHAAQSARHRVQGLGPDVSTLRSELARLEGEREELLTSPNPRGVALELGRQLGEALRPVDAAHGEAASVALRHVQSRIPIVTAELAALIRLLDALGHPTFSRAVPNPLNGAWVEPPSTGPLADLVRVADDFRLTIRSAERALDALDRLGGDR